MYVITRVLALVAALLGLELGISLLWWALHAGERGAIAELTPRIEAVSERLDEARGWLERRRAVGDSLDAMAEALERGPGAFPGSAAFDSARTRYAHRIRVWNEGLPEHERRNARLDSLAAVRDRLVDEWLAAYRRAYPGWLLLPRPDPPRRPAGDGTSSSG